MFRWQDTPPLVTLRSFCDGLADAKPVKRLVDLRFRYALQPNPMLIPPATRASDMVALLTFQLDARRFAVAAYIVCPKVAKRMTPLRITLQVDRKITDADVSAIHPCSRLTGRPLVLGRTENSTTFSCDIYNNVTWLRFEVE